MNGIYISLILNISRDILLKKKASHLLERLLSILV